MFEDGFMGFMGYRNMVVDDKIEECLDQIRNGGSEISVDRGDLTEDEVDYLEQEVRRRSKKGV